MNKHFLLLFYLTCLIMETTSTRCIICHLRTRTDRCRRGFGVCHTQKNESCMSLKIFQNDTLQVLYTVCQKFCKNLKYDFNNRTYVHECCYYNSCNYKF
uniref:Prostate and testis expressed 3 n=1 Tax=Sciurus vulgaris TaxID=55149 RepID=A0A8D2DGU3_SCIVU